MCIAWVPGHPLGISNYFLTKASVCLFDRDVMEGDSRGNSGREIIPVCLACPQKHSTVVHVFNPDESVELSALSSIRPQTFLRQPSP